MTWKDSALQTNRNIWEGIEPEGWEREKKKKEKGSEAVCVCAKEWPRLKKTKEFRRGVNERRNRQSLKNGSGTTKSLGSANIGHGAVTKFSSKKTGVASSAGRSHQKAQRLPWQKLWNVWKKVRAHQLRRVSGEVRSFGSLAFPLLSAERTFFWGRRREIQRRQHVESATSLGRALLGRALAPHEGCSGDAHDGQQMERS